MGGLKIGARNVSPMAKPSSSSRPPRNAPQPKVHRYIDALFGDNFGRLSKLTIHSANTFSKKRVDTASQSLQLKTEAKEKKARRIESREWRAIERAIEAELRESDHRSRLMWRSVKTKVKPEQTFEHTPPTGRRRTWPHASVALTKYDGPVIDRRGQRGVFMRVRYYSRRTAEPGVSQRVVRYCLHGAELDENGNLYAATNVGVTIDEALCGFDHLEQINWSAAKNAKLLLHGIFAVDHRQSPDEMMTCGVRWAEESLGLFDLPYLVTLHAPPPDGDERNWHLHILWSYRPLVRTGDHEWQVSEMLRTDLDNPAAMKVFREMFAAVMTEMSFEAGQNQEWTAKSNADRGLPHEPQVHLGGAKTNQARSGEYVAENEENHERVMRSKAAVIDDTLRHADEALAKAQSAARAITARFARMPTLPLPIPQRVVAANMALEAPAFGAAPPLSTAAIVIPAIPPVRAEPTQIIGSIDINARNVPRRSSVKLITAVAPQPASRPASIEIANLRIRSLRLAEISIAPVMTIPIPIARASVPRLSAPPFGSMPRVAKVGHRVVLPPIAPRPVIPRLAALPPLRPAPNVADASVFDQAIARADDARQRDDERRQREDQMVARAAQEARASASRLAAIERQQVEASIAPVAKQRSSSSWYLARKRREKAMADWDDVERLDDGGMTRPGRSIPRPGADRATDHVEPKRRFHNLPERGIGE